MKNNVLNNIENYNKEIDAPEHILFLKYIGLIHELIEYSADNIFIQKTDYLKYILITGIKNILYIFNFLILYTKNLDLTIYHTQKSILYYIEFIGQIGDDNHSFLKLNTKDATLFIYKKTIFEINNDFRKTYDESDETKMKMKNLHLYIDCYNDIIINTINNFDLKENTLKDLQKITFTKLYKIVESLIQLPLTFKLESFKITNKLENIQNLINIFNNNYSYKCINANYLYLIEYFIKKSSTKNIDYIKIKNKLNMSDIESILDKYSVCKIYNYLTN